MAKERADSFHRAVELFRSYFSDKPSQESWDESWRLLDEFLGARPHDWRSSHSSFSSAFDRALLWANSSPLPPADILLEARGVVEALVTTWFDAWEVLGRMVLSPGPAQRWHPWVVESVELALAEKRRIERAFAESWPVGSADEEQRALAEMKGGAGVGIDDAFARIAGVSTEAWLRRVEEHKRNRSAARREE